MVSPVESPDDLITNVSVCVCLSSFPHPTLLVRSKEHGHHTHGYSPSWSCYPHLKITGVPAPQCTFNTSVIFFLLFCKKQNTSSPPQSPTLYCHFLQGEAKALNKTPHKSPVDTVPHRHTSDLISCHVFYCWGLCPSGHMGFCRTPLPGLPSRWHLAFSEASHSLLSAFPSVSL